MQNQTQIRICESENLSLARAVYSAQITVQATQVCRRRIRAACSSSSSCRDDGVGGRRWCVLLGVGA